LHEFRNACNAYRTSSSRHPGNSEYDTRLKLDGTTELSPDTVGVETSHDAKTNAAKIPKTPLKIVFFVKINTK
jgi:hypothetical protein